MRFVYLGTRIFLDIVVKIVTKKLGEKYYKKKGVVVQVKDRYTAIVQLADFGNEKLKMDQTHLETVLPAIGAYCIHQFNLSQLFNYDQCTFYNMYFQLALYWHISLGHDCLILYFSNYRLHRYK